MGTARQVKQRGPGKPVTARQYDDSGVQRDTIKERMASLAGQAGTRYRPCAHARQTAPYMTTIGHFAGSTLVATRCLDCGVESVMSGRVNVLDVKPIKARLPKRCKVVRHDGYSLWQDASIAARAIAPRPVEYAALGKTGYGTLRNSTYGPGQTDEQRANVAAMLRAEQKTRDGK